MIQRLTECSLEEWRTSYRPEEEMEGGNDKPFYSQVVGGTIPATKLRYGNVNAESGGMGAMTSVLQSLSTPATVQSTVSSLPSNNTPETVDQLV